MTCSKIQFLCWLELVKEFYPTFDVLENENVVSSWFDELSGYDFDHLRFVLVKVKYAQVGGYPPDLSEIRRLMQTHRPQEETVKPYNREVQYRKSPIEICCDYYGESYVNTRLLAIGITPRSFSQLLRNKELKRQYDALVKEMISQIETP